MQPAVRGRIRELRIARGMTGKELGKKLGYARDWVSNVENNKTRNIPEEVFEELAHELGVSRSYLLLGLEERIPDELLTAGKKLKLGPSNIQNLYQVWTSARRIHYGKTKTKKFMSAEDWVWLHKMTKVMVKE